MQWSGKITEVFNAGFFAHYPDLPNTPRVLKISDLGAGNIYSVNWGDWIVRKLDGRIIVVTNDVYQKEFE